LHTKSTMSWSSYIQAGFLRGCNIGENIRVIYIYIKKKIQFEEKDLFLELLRGSATGHRVSPIESWNVLKK